MRGHAFSFAVVVCRGSGHKYHYSKKVREISKLGKFFRGRRGIGSFNWYWLATCTSTIKPWNVIQCTLSQLVWLHERTHQFQLDDFSVKWAKSLTDWILVWHHWCFIARLTASVPKQMTVLRFSSRSHLWSCWFYGQWGRRRSQPHVPPDCSPADGSFPRATSALSEREGTDVVIQRNTPVKLFLAASAPRSKPGTRSKVRINFTACRNLAGCRLIQYFTTYYKVRHSGRATCT